MGTVEIISLNYPRDIKVYKWVRRTKERNKDSCSREYEIKNNIEMIFYFKCTWKHMLMIQYFIGEQQ